MIVPARLMRRRLGLPAAASRVQASTCAVTADDGARLDTRLLRPAHPAPRRGAVLVRDDAGPDAGGPLVLLARFLAEDGATVVFQSCRGRGRSEGHFRPFEHEVADGGATVRWITAQPWFDGRLSLMGFGYGAFAAWAALAAAPGVPRALVTGFGARDPRAWIFGGGGFQLEVALALAAQLQDRDDADPRRIDLARAGRFLPARQGDRVAVRELPAFREWTLHAEPDDYWTTRTPPLPERPPATLQITGWYEPAIAAVLADHRALAERTESTGSPPPTLCVGPWGAVELPRRERPRDAAPLAHVARSALRFLARAGGESVAREAPVHVHVRGVGWRALASWPPERAATRTLHLRSGGAAQSEGGDGRLDEEPAPGPEPCDVFVSDPADPVPSRGGVAIASTPGPAPQADVERRGDVLCFTSAPLPRPVELAGEVGAVLFVATSAEAGDVTAKLVAVGRDGVARWLCEGMVACGRAEPGAPRRVEVDLGSAAVRVGAGERLRLQVASSSVPRFARHPQTAKARAEFGRGEGLPARQTLFHDAQHPSALRLSVLPARPLRGGDRAEEPGDAPDTADGAGEARAAGARNDTGPPAGAGGPARSARRSGGDGKSRSPSS